jgi:pyruvate/2-oxoacid:ferredoxin oxidoreductase beta subunit
MDDHDNLCPECNGGGYLAYYGPNEGERTELRHAELCYSCHDGVITATPTEEEEEGEYNPWEADEYERWLDSL